jgi:hypothetical protein
MRIYRISKRIYVQGVPLGTTQFCPYCCATVDTAFVTSRGIAEARQVIQSPCSSIESLSPAADRRSRIEAQP